MAKRMIIVLGGVVVLVAGFLLFRPDKLVVDDVADEALAEAFAEPAAVAESATTVPSATPSSPPGATSPPVSAPPADPTTTAPTTPKTIATGSFFGIDHRAMGTATIYEQDGRHVLRFEDDTDIQNGPDLYVWIIEDTNWEQPGDYLDLGKLEGNVGGQNYELPPTFDPSAPGHVLIWCLRFQVPFAAVELNVPPPSGELGTLGRRPVAPVPPLSRGTGLASRLPALRLDRQAVGGS